VSTHLRLEPRAFAENFPHRPFALDHGLSGHPLFQLQALAELAASMDGDRVEYNSGKLAIGQKPEETPRVDLEPVEVVRRIETANAWMVLKNVETVPAYRRLLEEVLTEVALLQGKPGLAEARMTDLQGFIFVSSANSVTPFHVDYEDNIFVQIAGPKYFHILDNHDRSLVSEADLETFPGKHRNLAYHPSFEARATVFEMGAGQGVFVPYTWPHWVRTGDRYSVSMAITWKTPEVLRLNKLRFVNAVLRRLRLPQPAPGQIAALDAAKVAAYTLARSLVEPLRRSEASRRLLRAALFGRKANYFYRKEAT